jgi:hypothetical protein
MAWNSFLVGWVYKLSPRNGPRMQKGLIRSSPINPSLQRGCSSRLSHSWVKSPDSAKQHRPVYQVCEAKPSTPDGFEEVEEAVFFQGVGFQSPPERAFAPKDRSRSWSQGSSISSLSSRELKDLLDTLESESQLSQAATKVQGCTPHPYQCDYELQDGWFTAVPELSPALHYSGESPG